MFNKAQETYTEELLNIGATKTELADKVLRQLTEIMISISN